ncbi:hypothetical protein OGATHE_001490 [Ogataea polymorpha]|uniref:F5/8 type C domain-containing protein n=1 Tax=Ogataea polymorpha TaxID=460523 RepID=A0A9P8TFS6_9ASCO|nr:hypothetical protein OGATHE_001490 [Ogataea polymorpha]
MSGIPKRSIAILSRPIPNAQPMLFFMPDFKRTSFLTIPQPQHSSQLLFHQTSICQEGVVHGNLSCNHLTRSGSLKFNTLAPFSKAAFLASLKTWSTIISIVFFRCIVISFVSKSDMWSCLGFCTASKIGLSSSTIMSSSGSAEISDSTWETKRSPKDSRDHNRPPSNWWNTG